MNKNPFQNIADLLKTSSSILGESVIYSPTIKRIILSLINLLICAVSGSAIFYGFYPLNFWIVLAVQFTLLIPLSIYFHMKWRVLQSLLIYLKLTNSSLDDINQAPAKISSQRFSVLGVALMEYFIEKELRLREDDIEGDEKSSGFFRMISNFILSSILSVLDVAENYLIAAVAIEQKGIVNAVSSLIQLKDNMPQSAAGIAGFKSIEIVGIRLISLIQIVLLIISVLLCLLLGNYVPDSLRVLMFDSWVKSNPDYSYFCFIPLIVINSLGYFMSRIFTISLETLESIYYTTLYTSVNYKDKIDNKQAQEITSSLNKKD